jgi:hypothetical protein
MLPRYHERPGRYFLPSGFTPVRITELLTNPFSLFYLLPNLKLQVLVLIWGLEQKKLESVFPQKLRKSSFYSMVPPSKLTKFKIFSTLLHLQY